MVYILALVAAIVVVSLKGVSAPSFNGLRPRFAVGINCRGASNAAITAGLKISARHLGESQSN